MISIRTKLTLFISLMIAVISTLSCLVFFVSQKRVLEDELKKLGNSLVILLARDSEVRLALSHTQYALLDTPIKKIRLFDRENEIGYWRISNSQKAVVEDKVAGIDMEMKEIPARYDYQNSNTSLINRIKTSSGEIFYDFAVPIFEKQIFSEEEFATQILDYTPYETDRHVLGFVQIGLSTRKLKEKINKTILYSIVPTGFGTVLGGIFITFLLTRYIVSPLQRLASITQDISKGNFNRTIDVRAGNEIGQLSTHFNQMTEALNKSFNVLNREMEGHKRTANELRMSEGKYRMLLENLPQKIFYKDRNLIYVSCNENYARDLKIKPNEIEGKTDYDFCPKELAEKYRADDKHILDSGQTEDFEEKYIVDGRELVVHTVKTPIKDEKGNIIGILGIFWDITEKIILQREAIRANQLASIGELAAGVAHEVNNPINGIINCAQLLFNKSRKGSRQKDFAYRIMEEGKRIAGIVGGLLSFARPGNVKDEKSSVHVKDLLSQTFILLESQMIKEGTRIRKNIPEMLPLVVVNPQHIQQVFMNVIGNARYALNQKYPKTHDNKIFEIVGEETVINNCSYVRVTFCDRGTGMPADVLEKVLEPFYTIKPIGKGTGLGLSISHGIVCDHGGKFMIDSIEGEFTKVSVVLPMSKNSLES